MLGIRFCSFLVIVSGLSHYGAHRVVEIEKGYVYESVDSRTMLCLIFWFILFGFYCKDLSFQASTKMVIQALKARYDNYEELESQLEELRDSRDRDQVLEPTD